jgi:predicted metal-dependent hydrolase
MSELPEYTLIKSRRRTIALSIAPDGSLIVKAPTFSPKIVINAFVRKNLEWIEKQQMAIAAHPPLSIKKYVDGEKFYYLGKLLTLRIGDYPAIEPTETELHFPKFLQFRIKKELTAWYKQQAEDLITQQVTWMGERMGASYGDIKFSDTKSKWGHCTHENNLQFNWRLIMAPILVLNYVVVHELAHTREKNHSRSFWTVVGKYNPSYRQQIKWLKNHGHSLIV